MPPGSGTAFCAAGLDGRKPEGAGCVVAQTRADGRLLHRQGRAVCNHVEDTAQLWRVPAYVERNPEWAGMVKRAEQYRWPSAAADPRLEEDQLGLLDIDLWRAFGVTEARGELLLSREEQAGLRLARRCTYAGRPYECEAFLGEIEERFDRRWLFETETGSAKSPRGRSAPSTWRISQGLNSGCPLRLPSSFWGK